LWRDDTRNKRKELEKVAFYHCDQVGTPQTLSNERGECIWEITQNTWGEALKIQASDDLLEQSHIRFQGQYYDEETGLHYNRYRYYEPYSARYMSKDPTGLNGGLNSSTYVSDPNIWIDALGLRGALVRNMPPTRQQQSYGSPYGSGMNNSRNPPPQNNNNLRTPSSFRDLLTHRSKYSTVNIYGESMPEFFRFVSPSRRENGVLAHSVSELFSNYAVGIENAILAPEGASKYLCKVTTVSYDKEKCKGNKCLITEFYISDSKTFAIPQDYDGELPICIPAKAVPKLTNQLSFK